MRTDAIHYAWQAVPVVSQQGSDGPINAWELNQATGQSVELGVWDDVNAPTPPGGSAVFKFKEQKPTPRQ